MGKGVRAGLQGCVRYLGRVPLGYKAVSDTWLGRVPGKSGEPESREESTLQKSTAYIHIQIHSQNPGR